jgi:hypothetical protein
VIEQNATHGLRRNAEEVGPALPFHLALSDKAKAGLGHSPIFA